MVTCQSAMMTICSSVRVMTLYYTDVASKVHSFDRNNAFRAYDSDNVDIVYAYGHAHVKVLQ